YRFFGFDAADGNFCHGAVGLPVAGYDRFRRLLEPLLESYRRETRNTLGEAAGEVKFVLLRKLSPQYRLKSAKKMAQFLREVGGFVAGFYTSTRGIVMERVRT